MILIIPVFQHFLDVITGWHDRLHSMVWHYCSLSAFAQVYRLLEFQIAVNSQINKAKMFDMPKRSSLGEKWVVSLPLITYSITPVGALSVLVAINKRKHSQTVPAFVVCAFLHSNISVIHKRCSLRKARRLAPGFPYRQNDNGE